MNYSTQAYAAMEGALRGRLVVLRDENKKLKWLGVYNDLLDATRVAETFLQTVDKS